MFQFCNLNFYSTFTVEFFAFAVYFAFWLPWYFLQFSWLHFLIFIFNSDFHFLNLIFNSLGNCSFSLTCHPLNFILIWHSFSLQIYSFSFSFRIVIIAFCPFILYPFISGNLCIVYYALFFAVRKKSWSSPLRQFQDIFRIVSAQFRHFCGHFRFLLVRRLLESEIFLSHKQLSHNLIHPSLIQSSSNLITAFQWPHILNRFVSIIHFEIKIFQNVTFVRR